MQEHADKDPWAMFCLASQRGNVSLAKSALRAMADKSDVPCPSLTKLTPELAKEVKMSYLLGLFKAALVAEHGMVDGEEGVNGNGNGGPAQTSWKDIAEKFTPVVG